MIISIHNERTGGSSLRFALKQFYGDDLLILAHNNMDQLFQRIVNKRFPHVIHGHIFFGVHAVIPQPCEYITRLRNPVERFISHAMFQLRDNPSADLEACLDDAIWKPLRNLYVRRLIGKWHRDLTDLDFEAALAILKTFKVVGTDLQFYFDRLKLVFAWPNDLELPLVGSLPESQETREGLSPDLESRIINANRYDLRLFEFAEKQDKGE